MLQICTKGFLFLENEWQKIFGAQSEHPKYIEEVVVRKTIQYSSVSSLSYVKREFHSLDRLCAHAKQE